jgi:hypothetical protein
VPSVVHRTLNSYHLSEPDLIVTASVDMDDASALEHVADAVESNGQHVHDTVTACSVTLAQLQSDDADTLHGVHEALRAVRTLHSLCELYFCCQRGHHVPS